MPRRLFGRDRGVRRQEARSERAEVSLSSYVSHANRVVVVDTETTGVYSSDRVIELAAVTLDLSGEIVDEWDTLVDPGRDVGPTWLHGITPSMLTKAPTFADVAGPFAARLHGAVLAAHNLPFDTRMIDAEFSRLGVEADFSHGFDTLRVTRCKLEVACQEYGVRLEGAHRALDDARATAQLLIHVMEQFAELTSPVTFLSPVPPRTPDHRSPRDRAAKRIVAPPSWFAGLAATLNHERADEDLVNYLDVLDRAMADFHLDSDERAELELISHGLGLDTQQVVLAHQRWLDDFMRQACADGVIGGGEYDQLCRAAGVLGISQSHVDERTSLHRTDVVEVTVTGGTVCFTGEPVDERGNAILRSELEAHARAIGLEPVESVTKARCDLLVAADPVSQSGKAGKARRYGIPIVAAADFLAAGSGSSLTGRATTVEPLDTLICLSCGSAWTRLQQRGRRPEICPECLG